MISRKKAKRSVSVSFSETNIALSVFNFLLWCQLQVIVVSHLLVKAARSHLLVRSQLFPFVCCLFLSCCSTLHRFRPSCRQREKNRKKKSQCSHSALRMLLGISIMGRNRMFSFFKLFTGCWLHHVNFLRLLFLFIASWKFYYYYFWLQPKCMSFGWSDCVVLQLCNGSKIRNAVRFSVDPPLIFFRLPLCYIPFWPLPCCTNHPCCPPLLTGLALGSPPRKC